MSLDVVQERRIPATRERVAAFATDPTNDTAWIGGIKRVRVLTGGPIGVGTRVERAAGFLGRSFEYVLEVTEFEPGRRLIMRSIEAPFPMTVRYEFEDDRDETTARVGVSGDPGRMYSLTGPLMAAAVRRNLARDLRRLEELVTASE